MKVYKIFWLALYSLTPTIPIGLIFSSPQAWLASLLYLLSVLTGIMPVPA